MTDTGLPSNVYSLRQGDFYVIPGSPWVYWVNKTIRNKFKIPQTLGDLIGSTHGTATYDNFRFLRFWWECISQNIFMGNSWNEYLARNANQPVLYMKGGTLLRWYGNQEYVVLLGVKGKTIEAFLDSKRDNIRGWEVIFKEGVTWSLISTKGFSVRYLPPGFIFDVAGSSGFPPTEYLATTLAIMSSSWMEYALSLINPTINFPAGYVGRVPFQSPSEEFKKYFDVLVLQCVNLQQSRAMHSENTFDYVAPYLILDGALRVQGINLHLTNLEKKLDELVFDLYDIDEENRQSIKSQLRTEIIRNDEPYVEIVGGEDTISTIGILELPYEWLSYSVGIILNRFQPGTPGALGSAIYWRSDFAIGSLPEPSEEEFNELVGEPSQFAYIDEQGGRHVFSREVEQALQKLALPDGIAVFDPNHPRDLPALVSRALELMLGQAQAQEVIQQAAGGDLRKFLEKDFFTQHHIKQYRKRPVYWPIQSSKRSYGFVLFHEKIDRNTFYALQQEPYLPTKRRAVQLRLEELSKKVLTAQGAARKPIEKEMDELRQLGEELAQFAKDLDAITRGGYEPEADWIDDGVILRMAPLWSVIPLWKSEPKKYWEELAAGKYDWSRIAMHYWPERVKQACKKNKSYAIAHGHEEWYEGG